MDEQALAERGAARLARGDAVVPSLGVVVEAVGPGTASASLRVTPAMVNGVGTTHGGFVFLLADTAFAYACNTRGQVVVASGGDIEFLEPTSAGDELVAVAEERVVRGRSGLYDVHVTCGGRTVAELRGRSRALRASGPADDRRPPEDAP